MLYETYVEKFIDFVIANVELLELFKGLDTLDILELASANVQKSDIFERGSNVTKTGDDWIVELKIFQAWEDFTCYL